MKNWPTEAFFYFGAQIGGGDFCTFDQMGAAGYASPLYWVASWRLRPCREAPNPLFGRGLSVRVLLVGRSWPGAAGRGVRPESKRIQEKALFSPICSSPYAERYCTIVNHQTGMAPFSGQVHGDFLHVPPGLRPPAGARSRRDLPAPRADAGPLAATAPAGTAPLRPAQLLAPVRQIDRGRRARPAHRPVHAPQPD